MGLIQLASFFAQSYAGTMAPRFEIYVKAAKDGKSIGDCPFSQFVSMVAYLKIPQDQYTRIPVDFNNKSKHFLTLNPDGTVPVLVDNQTKEVMPNSQLIVKYIDNKFPEPNIKVDYDGPAVEACSGVFSKFVSFLKNKDKEAIPTLKKALEDELVKVDTFLKSKKTDGKYLTGNSISALDCSILPKLRHVQVAGRFFQKFEIPKSLNALHEYIKVGEACDAFQSTRYHDDEIVHGWNRHGLVKVE